MLCLVSNKIHYKVRRITMIPGDGVAGATGSCQSEEIDKHLRFHVVHTGSFTLKKRLIYSLHIKLG